MRSRHFVIVYLLAPVWLLILTCTGIGKLLGEIISAPGKGIAQIASSISFERYRDTDPDGPTSCFCYGLDCRYLNFIGERIYFWVWHEHFGMPYFLVRILRRINFPLETA